MYDADQLYRMFATPGTLSRLASLVGLEDHEGRAYEMFLCYHVCRILSNGWLRFGELEVQTFCDLLSHLEVRLNNAKGIALHCFYLPPS